MNQNLKPFKGLLFWSLRGPAADVAVERGEWLALVLFVCHVPQPCPSPTLNRCCFWGGGVVQSRQEWVGEFLPQLALSFLLHQLVVPSPLPLWFSLVTTLSQGTFLAPQRLAVSPIHLCSLIPETGAFSLSFCGPFVPLGAVPYWTAPKMEKWGRIYFSPRTYSQFFSCQTLSAYSGPEHQLFWPAHMAVPRSFSLLLNFWVAPRLQTLCLAFRATYSALGVTHASIQ